MRIGLFWTGILVIVGLTSCSEKKYYYREGNKDEQIIKAKSDSAAYLEAYQMFQIAKKVHNNMKESMGSTYSSEPISFELLNSKREDITFKVLFESRDSMEKEIAASINKLPNSIKESYDKIREEKHGTGAKYDTGGLYLAPVKVLSAKFVEKDYSNYKDVALSYRNVSSKRIAAIRFKWYGENSFNEPADMGATDGWGGGFDDSGLRPGAKGYGTWSVLSNDGKKILIAYPYEVAFEDGSKWSLNGN